MKKYAYVISLILLILFIVACQPKQEGIGKISKTKACNLLSSVGLKARSWKNRYEKIYGCSSPYKDIGSGSLPNNIAYYVEGSQSNISQVKLVININNNNYAKSAHEELLRASKILSQKVIGNDLPEDIIKSILSGKDIIKKIIHYNIKVEKIKWSNGNGYEVKVIIR